MAVVSAVRTLTDLVEQFGAIPISRIRTTPTPGLATEHDVIDIEQHENRLFELYNGILVEKAMGYYESLLAAYLIRVLGEFVEQHDLGLVAGESGMIRLFPGEVRIPDVSFIRWERLPGEQAPREPIPPITPDLVVEVISPGNTPREMHRKLHDYFNAGARLVWYVYPDTRMVRVFTSVDRSSDVTDSQTLDGGEVLPGFSMPLSRLFENRRKKKPPPTA